MNNRSLSVLAIILIALMAIVAIAGLDGLPGNLTRSVNAAATRVGTDRTQFDEARSAVNRAIGREPELFRTQAAIWQSRLLQADNKLKRAESDMAKLQTLAKAGKRESARTLEDGLRALEAQRAGAADDAKNIRAEADRWLGYKQNLPQQIAGMQSGYEALKAFDLQTKTAPAHKAMTDWPAKRADLEGRLQSLEGLKKQGEEAWESTAASRSKVEARDLASVDYPTLFAAGEAINSDVREVQRGVDTANALAGQLYVGRDKVLLDLDDDDGRKQKVRVVETKYADAALTNPQATSREEWEPVISGRFEDLKKNIGMVVERKSGGKYDSEVERNAQPPGYAYIAPPGQSNQYGGWNNGVWSWLPQYLIMSQLLRTMSPPIYHGDYYGYDSARRRGGTWYGQNNEYGRTWQSGSRTNNGGWRGWGSGTSDSRGGTVSSGSTRPREGWNTGGSTYGGSRYESKGSYGGSRYQSRPQGGGSGFGSRGYSSGRSFSRGFGRGGRR